MLRDPEPVVAVGEAGPTHFIAIGGAGMSGIALLFAERGVEVSGSDQSPSAILDSLRTAGIRVHVGHAAEQLGAAQTVVVSSAIRGTNPELVAARERGLRVWHRSQALASLMVGSVGVSIAGTHGKTTTSGMTAVMLTGAGADPSYVIGSPLTTSGRAAHLGSGEAFVVEADESDGTFRQYPTTIAVVTNVEADHLDNWLTPEAYAAGFVEFASAPGVRVAIVNADDPGARSLASTLRGLGRRVVTYGEAADADVRISDLAFVGTSSSATVTTEGWQGELRLGVPGRHNLANATAALAVGLELGCDPDLLVAAAAGFGGTERRFQTVAEVGGVRVVDDYAHHPTEITATLTAARAGVGEGRVIACFQPHLYSRTVQFAEEFGRALALADEVVVLDVYAAREDPVPGVTGQLLADETARHIGPGRVRFVPDMADAPAVVAGLARPGDLVLTIGAGSVTTLGPQIASALREGGR